MAGIPYPIEKEILAGGKRIVLLKRPKGVFYNKNVMCLDTNNNILWQVAALSVYPGNRRMCPYFDIEFVDNRLKLWNWCNFYSIVDPETGTEIERFQTK